MQTYQVMLPSPASPPPPQEPTFGSVLPGGGFCLYLAYDGVAYLRRLLLSINVRAIKRLCSGPSHLFFTTFTAPASVSARQSGGRLSPGKPA